MDRFWAAPPVTRTLVALTFAQSALVYGGLLSGYHVIFIPQLIFKVLPQLWRLGSPFLLTGSGLSFIFDLYFSTTSCWTGSPRFSSPGDFFTYVFFVAFVIVVTLILAFVYTYAQENRGNKATFFVIQIPIELLPWAMLALTLVLAGWPAALSESMGIVAAHMYDFLTRLYPTFGGGRNYLTTPNFVRRFFAGYAPRGGEYQAYGTAYRPGQQNREPSSSGWASSFQRTWGGRGPGRRLGDS
ncbi:uncharacterized protein ACLA_008980 [Aspergillus clavatus NRRL 1]|uniref:Derlin n=1 Tax=Aspergillus clavatus (strain ATCC 1007 / CBS 513.65 / DSM 816 / NCTC 3887 / NRRL 1 / QM 1276 / 107) TaxID=344612 RepID=A1C9R0_ASPCL|nr:uncharacterized protein ACLA_008980 [Aspergillus clavatus NRRL 1]EAW12478.1 conserved hypothetical protein [Aspergillus clavatus NRRL 1]